MVYDLLSFVIVTMIVVFILFESIFSATKQRTKNRLQKMTTQTLLDFDLGESSSDSDFRIEDHAESDDDFSENSNEEDSLQDEDEETPDDEDNSDSNDLPLGKSKLSSSENKKEKINFKDILEKVASISNINDKV